MRYVQSKSWPWPVLRHFSDDYRRREFEVDVQLELKESSTDGRTIELTASFDLSDEALLDLVADGKAEYVLLVACQTTHTRLELASSEATLTRSFRRGELAESVDVSPFLICTEPVAVFRSANWHPDYGDRTFDLEPGAVLALDTPYRVWLEPAAEPSIGSIFLLQPDDKLEAGAWQCELSEGKVIIALHPEDYEKFTEARERSQQQGTGAYLVNGVFLPAVMWLLEQTDRIEGEPDADDKAWYEAVQAALARADLKPAPQKERDNLQDAQAILKQPFSALLPLLTRSR